MKNFILIFLLFGITLISCSKNQEPEPVESVSVEEQILTMMEIIDEDTYMKMSMEGDKPVFKLMKLEDDSNSAEPEINCD